MPLALSLEVGRPIDITHLGETLSIRRDGGSERVRIHGPAGFSLNGEPLDGERVVWITPSFDLAVAHGGETCVVQAVPGHGTHRYGFTCSREWVIDRRKTRADRLSSGKGRRRAG